MLNQKWAARLAGAPVLWAQKYGSFSEDPGNLKFKDLSLENVFHIPVLKEDTPGIWYVTNTEANRCPICNLWIPMSQFPGKLWQTWWTCFWLHVCRNPWLYSLLYWFAVLLSSFCSNLLLAGELVQECAGIYLLDISLISKSLKATHFNMKKVPLQV